MLSRAEYVGVNNIIKREDRAEFINYTTTHHRDWIEEAHYLSYGNLDLLNNDTSLYRPYIYNKTSEGNWEPDIDRDQYFVRTTQMPPPRSFGPLTNWNIGSMVGCELMHAGLDALKNETLTDRVKPFQALPPDEHQGFHTDDLADNPHSFVYHPVRKVISDKDSEIVASLTVVIAWDASMRNLLPDNVKGIHCVVQNSCNQSYSYEVNGKDAIYLGDGDRHNPKYDRMGVEVDLSLHTHPEFATTPGHCQYRMVRETDDDRMTHMLFLDSHISTISLFFFQSIYPNSSFEKEYNSSLPEIFVIVTAATFGLVFLIFLIYDISVKRRNTQLVSNAARANGLVASFFPSNIRDRVLADDDNALQSNKKSNNKNALTTFLKAGRRGSSSTDASSSLAVPSSTPLADNFDNTTIMFADMVGFTKWSSLREPSEVFTLLENVYSSFDRIAKRRRVFKVETVGDCYIAVCGLPDANPEHAVVMARFAQDCLTKMHAVTMDLEATLGTEVVTLSLRIGIHSGAVTGGVLRTQNARFQLFGDTMNTAARMESNGSRGRIHASQETADELIAKGFSDWVTPREEKVVAKGLGEMSTYWLTPTSTSSSKTPPITQTDTA